MAAVEPAFIAAHVDDEALSLAGCEFGKDAIEKATPVPLAVIERPVGCGQNADGALHRERPLRRVGISIDAHGELALFGTVRGDDYRALDAVGRANAKCETICMGGEQQWIKDVECLDAVIALHFEKRPALGVITAVSAGVRKQCGQDAVGGDAVDAQHFRSGHQSRFVREISGDDDALPKPAEMEGQAVAVL